MKKLFFSLLALVLAILPTNAQSVLGQFPANTVYCNPTGGTALAIPCTLTQVATILASGNNNAPQLQFFRAQNADVTTITGLFTGRLMVIGAQSLGAPGGGMGIFGAAVQDVNNAGGGSTSFPVGVTGYGVVNASGTSNFAYGLFGRCDLLLVVGSCEGAEVNCNQATDAPNVFPPVLTAPVTNWECNGIQSVNIGAGKGHIGFRAVATGGAWLATFYADPPKTGNVYGVFIDSGPTIGPTWAALLRGTGLANPVVGVQVMGAATPANAVETAFDASNNIFYQLSQSGTAIFGNAVSNPGGLTIVQTTNLNATTGSQAWFQATTNAGTLRITAANTVDGAIGNIRWNGSGGLLIDQANAAGPMSFRTGAAPTTAMTIAPNQVISIPVVATGTPVASLCIDAGNNIIKKTTAGSCI